MSVKAATLEQYFLFYTDSAEKGKIVEFPNNAIPDEVPYNEIYIV